MREELERDSLEKQRQMLSNICNSMNCLYWNQVLYLTDKDATTSEDGQLLQDIRKIEESLHLLLQRMM